MMGVRPNITLDRLQDRSGGLERAPESRIRGPLTVTKCSGECKGTSRVMLSKF